LLLQNTLEFRKVQNPFINNFLYWENRFNLEGKIKCWRIKLRGKSKASPVFSFIINYIQARGSFFLSKVERGRKKIEDQ